MLLCFFVLEPDDMVQVLDAETEAEPKVLETESGGRDDGL